MESIQFSGIKACVFDAYGTLFDVHSAVGRFRDRVGEKADAMSELWRTKQLQYTWLRSLMRKHTGFWRVTGDALDYAMAAHGIDDPELKGELMSAYRELDAYPEVKATLTELKRAGMITAILTNGTPDMIDAAVSSAGIEDLVDHSLSVEEVGIFKPDPSVYQLAVDRIGVPKEAISFQSSNAWDAVAAATFGFNVAWVNRFNQGRERLTADPHAEIRSLDQLLPILGIEV